MKFDAKTFLIKVGLVVIGLAIAKQIAVKLHDAGVPIYA